MGSALDFLELERVKEGYARLERRGISMSILEWYERRLAELRTQRRYGKRWGEIP